MTVEDSVFVDVVAAGQAWLKRAVNRQLQLHRLSPNRYLPPSRVRHDSSPRAILYVRSTRTVHLAKYL